MRDVCRKKLGLNSFIRDSSRQRTVACTEWSKRTKLGDRALKLDFSYTSYTLSGKKSPKPVLVLVAFCNNWDREEFKPGREITHVNLKRAKSKNSKLGTSATFK